MAVLLPAPLEGPFRTPPQAQEMKPTEATRDLVRHQVQALLASAPSYHALADPDRRRLEEGMVHIASYAAECVRELCWQSEQLGQTPVVKQKYTLSESPVVEEAGTHAPLARAQQDFKPQAASQVARITKETLRAVAFPTFVADLIRGTFDAIVKTSIQQMESFMELVGNVSGTVDEFQNNNISDVQAKSWLAQKYPDHIEFKEGEAHPKDTDRPLPSIGKDLKLGEEISSLDESVIEEKLVPAARRRLAETRLQMLSTLVLMGVNRIVVTGGKIRATMGFHIDTTDRARQQTASDFDFRSSASGSFGYGPWSASVSTSIAYVTSKRTSSEQEINTETDLTAEVELHFKSDYFPLQRFAPGGTIGTIRGHTAAPEANPMEGETPNPLGSGTPAVGGDVPRHTSTRSRRSPKPADDIRPIGAKPPAPEPPVQPTPVEKPAPAPETPARTAGGADGVAA